MQVEYRKKFLKELARIPFREREEVEKFVFEIAPKASDFYALQAFEQMKGYPSYYKVRFGNYRVGVQYQNDVIVFERVLHRKEIYRYFP